MARKNILLLILLVLVAAAAGYFFMSAHSLKNVPADLDPTPQNVTLSGTYVCLPHVGIAPGAEQSQECALGLKTDDGVYYAVNFGASAHAMEQFRNKIHITAEGFVVIKEALNSDKWAIYDMRGIFTITKMIDPAPVYEEGGVPTQ